jgi:hypothetical protein
MKKLGFHLKSCAVRAGHRARRGAPPSLALILCLALLLALTTGGCLVNAIPKDLVSNIPGTAGSGGSQGSSGSVSSTVLGSDGTTTSLDGVGNSLLTSNNVTAVYNYRRANDSSSANQLATGIDPNWYNGVTRMRGAFNFSGGVGDYVRFSNNAPQSAVATFTAVTAEAWVRGAAAWSTNHHVLSVRQGTPKYPVRLYVTAAGLPAAAIDWTDGSTTTITGGTTLSILKWYHLAVTYDGANVNLWVNGIADAAAIAVVKTPSKDFSGADYAYIGSQDGTNGTWNGEIAEARLSNKARYTGAFTPSARFENDSYTILLAHGDEGPGSTTIYNAVSDTINTTQGALYMAGDPTGTLTASYNTSMNNASSALTLEAWLWVATYETGNTNYILYRNGAWALYMDENGKLNLSVTGLSTNTLVTSAASIPKERWVHVAGTYDGAALRVFIDGTLDNTAIATGSLASNTNGISIGSYAGGGVPMIYDEVRVASSALYTATFTPKRRLTDVSNTILMYHFDETSGTSVADSSGYSNTGTVTSGNGSASLTEVSPTSAGRVPPLAALNANNSTGVTIPNTNLSNSNTATALTLEAWIFPTSLPGAANSVIAMQGRYWLYVASNGQVYYYLNTAGGVYGPAPCSAVGAVTAGSWQHVAMTWDSATSQVITYVNGTVAGTCGGAAGANITANAQTIEVGAWYGASGFTGLIHNARISYSVVYTGAFTPSRLYPKATNEEVHLPFNVAAGATSFTDVSGKSNTATVGGTSTTVGLNAQKLVADAIGGSARLWPTSPHMTTGCEGITHTGGLDDDSAIEVWITKGGSSGYAAYQWRKVGGASWGNAFNGVNLTSSTSSTALGASGVSVAFTSGATFATDDHCLITSWAIENGATEGVLNTNRGTANAFPSSAVIVATTSGIDIIDTTTTPNSVWMKIPLSSSWSSVLPSNASSTLRIEDLYMLNGKLYVAINDLTGGSNASWGVIDFTRDRADAYFALANSNSYGPITAPRSLAQRTGGVGNYWSGNNQGVYARSSGTTPSSYGATCAHAINRNGKQWATFCPATSKLHLVDEYNGAQHALYNGASDVIPKATFLSTAGSSTGIDIAYWNETQNYVGVYTGVESLVASVTGASSYTRQYASGGTPGIISDYPVTSLRGTSGTSSVASSHNSLYVGQTTGVSVIQEALVSAGGSSKLHVPNSSNAWPFSINNTLSVTGSAFTATIPTLGTMYTGGDYTLEAMINSTYDPGGAGYYVIASMYQSFPAHRGVLLFLNGSASVVSACHGTGVAWNCYVGTKKVNDGKWHHVATSLSGTTLRIYVDGILDRIHTGVGVPAALLDPTNVGCIGQTKSANATCLTGSGNGFRGKIAWLRFSNTARYTSIAPGVPASAFTPDSNTLGLWDLTQSAGATVSDRSTNGLDATLAGANYSWAAFTAPTADYSYSSALGNHVSAVAPSSDGNTLFIGINNYQANRGGVIRLYQPNSTAAEATHTFNASSSPALVNERVTSLSCTNTDPDVYVGTMGGYTFLNFGPY